MTTRRQLVGLGDDSATQVTLVLYSGTRDALLKALME